MPPADTHEHLRSSVRAFLAREVPPALVRQIDELDAVPEQLVSRMAELGYLGAAFPEKLGGGGGDLLHLLVLLEELSRVSAGICGVVGTCALFGGVNLMLSGSPDQQSALLPGICQGTVRCAMAVTEPDAGSDVSAITTRAVRSRGGWLVSGRKVFTSGALEATHVLVLARTGGGERRHDGMSLLIVPRKTPGFEVRKLSKIGTRGLSTCELFLDEAPVPAGAVLGGPGAAGSGWRQLMKTFELERITVAATSLGIASAALDEAVTYAAQRRQFGRPIGEFQAVAHLLADMATDVEACRAFLYTVAERAAAGEPCAMQASMLKLFVTERVKQVCLSGMQVLGGYGYLPEYGMERHLRDALLGPVGAGTSQVQRSIIARHLGFRA